ncbi:fimbrial biogenesis outer membrane usher protein [Xenorhabdus nematophila]|uniref:fimbria/pilus outer membrane usher protein n=1 Tax=Xenorhabdus nematophila TaxID=628 RepID=UPI0005427A7F|nr:fimbria/pilus outer membrane usher protein [Xenorhabdus nematophila]CEF32678.1 putative outer membrane usher protein precursor [Xenorhabdus nematophila str. Websteri]AYA40639.1 fimbrial biogenesis outer membrane usher protein [Xenorhabdus nematophila]KHD29283.1 membrane protein [Xenorhabdus nematophila]MBA0019380.1 fimbrial biogenesis outer membrane usher protein [Xenorhabdus nematophila]MCB4424215.1 fimbria/pilus outer membrane usher protein [Xenorhabdus nematophila]
MRWIAFTARGWLRLFLLIGFLPVFGYSSDYFDLDALEIHDPSMPLPDLSYFAEKGGSAPGIYHVDIRVNGQDKGDQDIQFVLGTSKKLQPVLSVQQLIDWGVNVAAFPGLNADTLITDLADTIPYANTTLQFSQQTLLISFPQAAMTAEARGAIDSSLWQQGEPALWMNYDLSGAETRNKIGPNTKSFYLNLRNGLNWGAWRLRNYSTYHQGNSSESRWENLNTYLQRDIHLLKSQLVIGETNTRGELFSGFAFRGATLMSDDNMLPDSQRGFAPVVRGIAESNAQITIRQNGYMIYQAYVPPGAFIIDDLYPTSSGGDLDVVIREADGRERHFVQSFSSAPVMLREGRFKYNLTAGEYRNSHEHARRPVFMQSEVYYGLPHATTVYSGTLLSANYQAYAIGVGHSFGHWGSLSFDITQSQADIVDEGQKQGWLYRTQYTKDFEQTGTNLSLVSYYYPSPHFYDLPDANHQTGYDKPSSQSKHKFQLTLSQNLSDYGSVYFSGDWQNHWGKNSQTRRFNVGYSVNCANINYTLNYTQNMSSNNSTADKQLAFNIQIPLDRWLRNSWANYSINHNRRGDINQSIGLSGTALDNGVLGYSLQQRYGNNGQSANGNIHLSYKARYGELSGGYNYNDSSKQINYGLRGGIVAHRHGVTLSQPLGETIVLVKTPGAAGVKINGYSGVETDGQGHAVLPYVSAYHRNRIALSPDSFGKGVEIESNIQTVIPTQGAMVVADFRTWVGHRVLFTLTHRGKPIPFGAIAALYEENKVNKENKTSSLSTNQSIVGNGGEVYFGGVPEQGQLSVQWGGEPFSQCKVSFVLPKSEAMVISMKADCQ